VAESKPSIISPEMKEQTPAIFHQDTKSWKTQERVFQCLKKLNNFQLHKIEKTLREEGFFHTGGCLLMCFVVNYFLIDPKKYEKN